MIPLNLLSLSCSTFIISIPSPVLVPICYRVDIELVSHTECWYAPSYQTGMVRYASYHIVRYSRASLGLASLISCQTNKIEKKGEV